MHSIEALCSCLVECDFWSLHISFVRTRRELETVVGDMFVAVENIPRGECPPPPHPPYPLTKRLIMKEFLDAKLWWPRERNKNRFMITDHLAISYISSALLKWSLRCELRTKRRRQKEKEEEEEEHWIDDRMDSRRKRRLSIGERAAEYKWRRRLQSVTSLGPWESLLALCSKQRSFV